MKRIVILMALITMGSSTFSQDLTPRPTRLDGKLHLCFDTVQAKTIAKVMADQVVCDSLVEEQAYQISDLQERKDLTDRELGKALEQVEIQRSVIGNQGEIVEGQKIIIEDKETEIKKQKRHKVLSFFGMLVSLTLAVVT